MINSRIVNEGKLSALKITVSSDRRNPNFSSLSGKFCIFEKVKDWIIADGPPAVDDVYNFGKYESLRWMKNEISNARDETKVYKIEGIALSLSDVEEENGGKTIGMTFLKFVRKYGVLDKETRKPRVFETLNDAMNSGYDRDDVTSYVEIKGLSSSGNLINVDHVSDYRSLNPNRYMPAGLLEDWVKFCADVNSEIFKAALCSEFIGSIKGLRKIDSPDTVKWQIAINHILGKDRFISAYQQCLLRTRSADDFEFVCKLAALASEAYKKEFKSIESGTPYDKKTFEIVEFLKARPNRDFYPTNGLKVIFNGKIATSSTIQTFELLTTIHFNNTPRVGMIDTPEFKFNDAMAADFF